jgi:hypothetical protein
MGLLVMIKDHETELDQLLSYLPATVERQVRRAQIGVLVKMIGHINEQRRDAEDLDRLAVEMPPDYGSW